MQSRSSESDPDEGEARRRRLRLRAGIKQALRALSIQLSLLNHQVGAQLELKDVDLDCLDLIGRHGPLSPSGLAQRAGLHPATVTGILDRLERGGWIARERDTADRRAVVVRALRQRNAEVVRLFAGMNSAMDQICADYAEPELELLATFLTRTIAASQQATEALAAD